MDSSPVSVIVPEIDDSQEFEIGDSESVRYLSDGWESVVPMYVPQTELPRHRYPSTEQTRPSERPPVPEEGESFGEVEIRE